MRNDYLMDYRCPLFLYDPEARRGQLLNPATGLIELEFPRQEDSSHGYCLHSASLLSPEFAHYLYYLVNDHILFTRRCREKLVCVEEESDTPTDHADDTDCETGSHMEFSAVWYRAPLEFTGLAGFYDRMGFCFLDEALYGPMYCEVIEMRLRDRYALRNWQRREPNTTQ